MAIQEASGRLFESAASFRSFAGSASGMEIEIIELVFTNYKVNYNYGAIPLVTATFV